MAETIIPNGATVTWSNNTLRGPKWKSGKILAYVPAWTDPIKALGRLRQPHERADGLGVSKNNRYLVAVPRGGKSRLMDLYTPYASQVIVVAEKEKE